MTEIAEARAIELLGDAARAWWQATGADPFATLGDPPALAALRGELAGSPYQRFALAAAFTSLAPIPAARTEPAFLALAAARARAAARLGFPDTWSCLRSIHGDLDLVSDPVPVPLPLPVPDFALPDPSRVLSLLSLPPIPISVTASDAPVPGRTFVLSPTDVRIRVWRRPGATARGTLRVLLHELGHARLALADPRPPPSTTADETAAAACAAQLEDPGFVAALGLPPELAAAERASHLARAARLAAAAAAERAFFLEGGPPPWQSTLAWLHPGGSASYAAAEAVRSPA